MSQFLGRTAIAGFGFTELSKASDKTVLGLASEACRAAVADAGLATAAIDGIVSFSLFNDSVSTMAVASTLAIPELTYQLDLNLGGEAPCAAVMHAAMAIASGQASNVLVFRALKGRSGVRIGSTPFEAPTTQYRLPIGLTAYPQYIALWTRRYLIETGSTERDLAAVVVEQRRNAALNDAAIRRAAITEDDYFRSPYVAEPLRVADCTTEVDGAYAVLVTSTDRARDLPHPVVAIRGAAWATGPRPGLDITDVLAWPDYSRNCHSYLSARLWRSADLSPQDVDLAQIYDCFSSVVLYGLEGLGLTERGGAGEFMRSGAGSLRGRLPVNTNGGLLCEGYVHGMNTVVEAVRQLQGRAGARQVPSPATCVVTSGALVAGSALVLERCGP